MENIDQWGIDIFRIADLTTSRPLTVITYTILQVSQIDLRNNLGFLYTSLRENYTVIQKNTAHGQ